MRLNAMSPLHKKECVRRASRASLNATLPKGEGPHSSVSLHLEHGWKVSCILLLLLLLPEDELNGLGSEDAA